MTRIGGGNAMLTARDVASLLSVDINTVRRWTNNRILKAYRIGPRGDRRFRQEDIALFLIEQSEKDACNEQADLMRRKRPKRVISKD